MTGLRKRGVGKEIISLIHCWLDFHVATALKVKAESHLGDSP